MKNWKVLITICVLGCTRICAQETGANDTVSRHPLTHGVGIDFRPVYLIPTNEFFAGENAAWQPLRKSVSAHLKYSFRFHPDSRYGKLYPHTYQGIGVSYHSFFDKAEIGTPVAVYAFQGARITRLSSRLSLDYEWNFGASFGWKKYHPGTNAYNYVVGSKINAYINLGFLLNWQLAAGWQLTTGIDLSHFSNGNTQYPNAGVNTVGGRIGLVHTFRANAGTVMTGRRTTQRIKPHISYDIVLYGASKRKGVIKPDEAYLAPGSFGVLGFNFNPMYNFHQYFRAGASLDVQYDESAQHQGIRSRLQRPGRAQVLPSAIQRTIGSRAIRTGRTGHADLHDQCRHRLQCLPQMHRYARDVPNPGTENICHTQPVPARGIPVEQIQRPQQPDVRDRLPVPQ